MNDWAKQAEPGRPPAPRVIAIGDPQSTTDAGIQLPWNPFGMRGSSIDATGVLSMVAASMITKLLLSE